MSRTETEILVKVACAIYENYAELSMNARSSARNPFARNRLHHLTKTIQFTERSVEIWRDANAGEFLMHNWGGEDTVLAEKVVADCALIEPLNFHIRDRARLIWIE